MENRETDGIATALDLHQFFSLKWKALLSTTLVLVAVIVAISLRHYIDLTAQFDQYRQAAHERYTRNMQALIDQSLERLNQLGDIIPRLPGMQQSLAGGDVQDIIQAFEPQWPVLAFRWGIDVVAFYDRSSSLITSWESTTWEESRSQQNLAWITPWIAQVNQQEEPLKVLHCNAECMQYAAVPSLADSQSVGVVLVSSSLADVVSSFRQISDNEIGLIVTGNDNLSGADQARWIAPWNARVVALTFSDKAQNLEILKQAAAASPLTTATGEGLRSVLDGRSYEIMLVPLPGYVGPNEAYLAVIADITATLAEIRNATREIVIVGGIGWLCSELLLLAILWTPMSRLRLTARNLPRLAERQFQAVRAAIAGYSRRHYLRDEIDILDATTIKLANRLEQLEHEVIRRMEELSQERDFNANLLDTAQVMIVTLDRQGRIVMVNPFAQALTGYQEDELIERDFIDVLLPQESNPELRRHLQEDLAVNERKHLRHEALVTCKDGTIRNITWYHSRLTGLAPDDPVILSVGLDITERLHAEDRLAWQADHDTLTGLLNRRGFQEQLESAVTTAQRQNKTGALLVIDLDQFKYVNEAGSHHSGDTLLKLVADSLSEHIVVADIVARLGGDEFALLVRESDAEDAIEVATAINALLSGIAFPVGDHTLRMSASIGIVLFPTHGGNADELLASADLAMYQAKEAGRGHWRMFSEEDNTRERLRNRVYWKDKVAQALAEDGFILYYQPIMEITTGRVSHYEVLLRMRGEDGGIISAAHFIDAAERSGLIHALDHLVVSKALQSLAEVNRRGWDVAFSINLSGHAFSDPQLLPHVRQELERTQVATAKVIFEITETAAVSDFAVATHLMLAIKELGCRFALDDFGIGFASFYYLKHLPVDYLKIDGSFIRQLSDSLDDQIIVRAMSQTAAGFGKKTIAEYVETEATLKLLGDYGIDYAQGYLISKPLSAAQAFPWEEQKKIRQWP